MLYVNANMYFREDLLCTYKADAAGASRGYLTIVMTNLGWSWTRLYISICPARQNLIPITNLAASTGAEIDQNTSEWRLPDSVDDASNTPGRMLSSNLCEEVSHELHQLEDPEKLNVNGGREHCQERSRLPYASILAHMLLSSSYRIDTRLVPRHITRLRTIPTQQQSLPRNGYYQSLQYQPGLVLPIQHLQFQLRLTRHILLSTMSLAALSTTASMPHNGIRWLV